jgi:hypothetical protein
MAQQLPSRDDPLYDYLARERPSPATLLRTPRSADEFLRAFPSDAQAGGAIARWKLGDAPSLPAGATLLTVEVQAFAFPRPRAIGAPQRRLTASWARGAIDAQTLLEVVWSDARRRTGENPSAFDAVPLRDADATGRVSTLAGRLQHAALGWAATAAACSSTTKCPPCCTARFSSPCAFRCWASGASSSFSASSSRTARRLGGARGDLERDFGAQWTLALAEAFKALALPEGAVSQIIPYYLYQKWYSNSRRQSGWFNYLAEVGVVYKPDAQSRVYLFWLMDDLRAPTALGGSSITPRKVATLMGARLHPTPNTRVILELVRSDGTPTGGVYDNSNHPRRYAYYYKDLPMGHPIGANRVGLYARAEHEAGRWLYAVDYTSLRRFHEYRPGVRGYVLGITVGYQVSERGAISLQYRASRLRDTGAPITQAGWYLQAIAQF